MTDEEMACKAICDSIPCKTMCTKCKCYIAGFKAGRETEREYVKNNAFTSMKRASKTVQSSSTMSNLPKQKKLLKRF